MRIIQQVCAYPLMAAHLIHHIFLTRCQETVFFSVLKDTMLKMILELVQLIV